MMDVWQEFHRLSTTLSPSVKLRVRQVVPVYLDRVRAVHDPLGAHRTALAALKLRFPNASPKEADLLAFYLIGLGAAMKGGVKGPHSMNEMGEMESLRLQMAMDRMSKLMSTLSNLLKKTSETANGIATNIK